jgi:tRNA G46 methylase TrmB
MRTTLAFVAAAGIAFSAAAEEKPINAGPYVPSPQSVVTDMLKLAGVSEKDFVIDLGSGDGRIVLTAAKVFGARGFGVEIQDKLVQLSNEGRGAKGSPTASSSLRRTSSRPTSRKPPC